MQAELASLEALPVESRTPEALERAFELDRVIRAHNRAHGVRRAPRAPSAPKALVGPHSPPVSVLIKVPAQMHAELKAECRRSGESMSSVIRGLIRKYLESLG